MCKVLFYSTSKRNTMDIRKAQSIPTKNFSCAYCKLLWLLSAGALYPLKTIRNKRYCILCATDISNPLIHHTLPLTSRPSPLLFPHHWPSLAMLIGEAFCCYCPTRLCKNNFKLSECTKGLVVVRRYNEEHSICMKCFPTAVTDYLIFGDSWRCKCRHPGEE